MLLEPGQKIDRYVVEGLLGVGGMAEVWAVRHRVLGTQHALKVMLNPRSALRRRLIKEGRAQAILDHPNLLPVRDVLDIDGQPALLLPLVEGPALDALLKRYRPTQAASLSLLRAIVEGLRFAHSQGFVHRDLKPGNVLLDLKRGHIIPRISDFGLVKTETDSSSMDRTRSGVVFGTPAYAAPEQLQDASAVDARADLFSLGVMLVRMLTGVRPFDGTSPAAILRSQRHPPNLGDLRGDLRALASALLAIRPDDRPPNGDAVLHAIDGIQSPRQPSAYADLVEAVRRHRIDRSTPETLAPESGIVAKTWDSAIAFAAAKTAPQHNLPPPRDAFVGRAAELEELEELVSPTNLSSRLFTITGTGGTGKTRLALEHGRASLSRWTGGVWICDLTEAWSVQDILSAVADALSVPLERDPNSQLAEAIRGRGEALFIFDNFEQIVDHAAETVGRWLDIADRATFLVTSRQPLRLRGEHVYMLEPFGPGEASALFADRAHQADRRFQLTEDNRPQIEALVKMLDGLPLAIELAAARIRGLPPARLMNRLQKRFQLLQSRSPDLTPRQRTLRATLQWSWDLLRPWEQDCLAQAACFEGGFTFEAAEVIIDLSAYPQAPWVEDVLAELAEKSLLQTRSGRLSMLVSIQDFAREAAPEMEATQRRHGDFFATFGSRPALEALDRHGDAEKLAALGQEIDNLIAACKTAARGGRPQVAVDCARATLNIYALRGPFAAGLELIADLRTNATLADPRLEADVCHMETRIHQRLGEYAAGLRRARRFYELVKGIDDHRREALALNKCGILLRYQGYFDEALEVLEQALSISQHHRYPEVQATTLNAMANIFIKQNRQDDAERCHRRALQLSRDVGDRYQEAAVLGNLGAIYINLHRFDEAKAAFDAAMALHKKGVDLIGQGILYGNMGILEAKRRNYDDARHNFERALAIQRDLKNRRSMGILLGNLGALHFDRFELAQARDRLNEALQIQRQIGNRSSQGILLGNLGLVEQESGDLLGALDLFQRAIPILHQNRLRRFEAITLTHLGEVLLDMKRSREAREALTRAALAARTLHDETPAVIQALQGALAAEQGDPARGRQLVDAALQALRPFNHTRHTLKALCRKVAILQADDDLVGAAQALQEVVMMANRHNVPEDTAVMTRIGDLKRQR